MTAITDTDGGAHAPYSLFHLLDGVLAGFGRRRDLPATVGGWIVDIREQLRPAAREIVGNHPFEAASVSEFAEREPDQDTTFQDLLFAIHVLAHFLERQDLPVGEGARDLATTALARMIRIYLFFLKTIPTIQEQSSPRLDLFVARYGDAELRAWQAEGDWPDAAPMVGPPPK